MITVQLLGGACLRSGDVPLSGPPAQRHRIALLALIVAAWPRPLARDRALALLWPERDAASARRLLNLAVHVLRATLGDHVIISAGNGLVLDPSRLSCDLHALRVAISAGDHDRVTRLYTGPLLDGFHLSGAREFDYWLDERRSELAHAYVSSLLAVAEGQQRSGDALGRVGTCRKLVAADPYSTGHALALMHALDAAGDHVAARHHAIEHSYRLRADLDVDPDPEIAALAERLRVPAVAHVEGIAEDVVGHLSRIRVLVDLFAVQADVALRIAAALQTELDRARSLTLRSGLADRSRAGRKAPLPNDNAVPHSATRQAGRKEHDERSS